MLMEFKKKMRCERYKTVAEAEPDKRKQQTPWSKVESNEKGPGIIFQEVHL